MRLLVCGSRDFENYSLIWDFLAGLCQGYMTGYGTVHLDSPVIIEDGATGADSHAKSFVSSPSPFAAYVDGSEPLEFEDD